MCVGRTLRSRGCAAGRSSLRSRRCHAAGIDRDSVGWLLGTMNTAQLAFTDLGDAAVRMAVVAYWPGTRAILGCTPSPTCALLPVVVPGPRLGPAERASTARGAVPALDAGGTAVPTLDGLAETV